MATLEISHLSKKFGNVEALRDINITVGPKEIHVLIGPNGSGKTTILKTVAGLLRPTSGTISVDRTDITEKPVETKAKIGYIPDEPSIWSGMTGSEFLNFSGALFGLDEKTRIERIKELLDLFHLSGIENSYFDDYSRGNKQKFSIMAALLHKPEILLVDEPIVGLDPESAAVAKEQFRKFAENGGSILLATHTLPVAEEIATKISVMKYGNLIATNALGELRTLAKLPNTATLEEIYKSLTS